MKMEIGKNTQEKNSEHVSPRLARKSSCNWMVKLITCPCWISAIFEWGYLTLFSLI
jgi:hypothetical protein